MNRQLDFNDVSLYGVTGRVVDADLLLAKAESMTKAGLDAFQLRTRELTDRQIIDLGKKLRLICHRNNLNECR